MTSLRAAEKLTMADVRRVLGAWGRERSGAVQASGGLELPADVQARPHRFFAYADRWNHREHEAQGPIDAAWVARKVLFSTVNLDRFWTWRQKWLDRCARAARGEIELRG